MAERASDWGGVKMPELPNKARLTIREVADYWQVKEKTVRSWIDQGILEAIKIGGTVRVTPDAVRRAERVVIQ